MDLAKEIKIGNHRYVDLREISVGGTAVVYRGIFEALDIDVVVKVLRSQNNGYGGVFDVEETFKQEAELTCQLQHPNIVKVHDFDTSDQVKIVFDYIDGLDLRDVKNLVGKMSDIETLVAMEWVCYALEEAHKRGIYHRDISPGNIIIPRETHRSMLMDFGMAATEEQYGKVEEQYRKMHPEAKERSSGSWVGRLEYMSPEQKEGKRVDEYSDIFSMGRVIVGMLTGRDPRYVNLDQRKLPIEKDIVRICKTATAENREERFESAAKLREKIKGHLWKRKIKTIENMEAILRDVLERAYDSKDALEERMDKSWEDINHLSVIMELWVARRSDDVLKSLAEERRDLVEEIFEKELVVNIGGTAKTLFASLQKIKGMSSSRFKGEYEKILKEGEHPDQKISKYLDNRLAELRSYIATFLKLDSLGYQNIIKKIEEGVVKTVNMYDHEHIFVYEPRVQIPILESLRRAQGMTERILKKLEPENEKYIELGERIERRRKALDERIKLEEKR